MSVRLFWVIIFFFFIILLKIALTSPISLLIAAATLIYGKVGGKQLRPAWCLLLCARAFGPLWVWTLFWSWKSLKGLSWAPSGESFDRIVFPLKISLIFLFRSNAVDWAHSITVDARLCEKIKLTIPMLLSHCKTRSSAVQQNRPILTFSESWQSRGKPWGLPWRCWSCYLTSSISSLQGESHSMEVPLLLKDTTPLRGLMGNMRKNGIGLTGTCSMIPVWHE